MTDLKRDKSRFENGKNTFLSFASQTTSKQEISFTWI